MSIMGCLYDKGTPRLIERKDCTYEYSTQLYRRDTHDAVDISFHSSWTLEQVEEHVEGLFKTGMYDYYERWSE